MARARSQFTNATEVLHDLCSSLKLDNNNASHAKEPTLTPPLRTLGELQALEDEE